MMLLSESGDVLMGASFGHRNTLVNLLLNVMKQDTDVAHLIQQAALNTLSISELESVIEKKKKQV